MRVVIASCSVDYSGRLDAHLPRATRVLMLKADGSVLIHSDGGSYKPLNWMSAPARLAVTEPDEEAAADGVREVWEVSATKTDDRLVIRLFETISDVSHELGVDPGLTKDGVEAHLQELLAEQIEVLGAGYRLVRREFPTAIGPVDIMAKDSEGRSVAVEIKRVGGIDGVEQLTVISAYLHSGQLGTEKMDQKYAHLELVDARMAELLESSESGGPQVIMAGDLNVVRSERDIKNWKPNHNKIAGVMDEEIAHLEGWFASGWVDASRHLVGDEEQGPYTWWSQRGKAFDNNAGWRIDYQVLTPALAERARSVTVDRAPDYASRWSDHAPLVVDYAF